MNLEQKAQELFQQWNETLQTKDKVKVAELYTDDNAFLPTLSGDFKRGLIGAEDYFEHFLEKNPFGVIIVENVSGDENNIIHSGLYDFEIDDSSEGRVSVEARFTFVYTKCEDEKYKISHHHSSLKPVNL